MAKRVSPAIIGVFVAASFALILALVVVVGSGRLFQKSKQFVCMFQGNLNGLKVGAPVKFKGVQIGTVEQIRLSLNPDDGVLRPDVTQLRLPVIIGIDRSLMEERGASGQALTRPGFEEMLNRGLRAQLAMESLLTGLLFVDLDLEPQTQRDLVLVPGKGDLQEIPTIPTNLEAIQKQATEALVKLDRVDLNRLVASITAAADSIQQLTSSPEIKSTLESLKGTIANLNETVTQVRTTFKNANSDLRPLMARLESSSAEANATMKDAREALVEFRAMVDPDAPIPVRLNATLDQAIETMKSMSDFIDYLQRNPASLVRGKYVPEKDR